MKLIVGLGNPGLQYYNTRHNAGFLVLDVLAQSVGVSIDANKFGGLWGKGSLLGQPCCFLKPQTYMNLSGRSVRHAMSFYKLSCNDLIVLHDDIDLPFGKVKTKLGGGHGGNNGIRSIIADLGSSDFCRIKLGVGRPGSDFKGQVSDWVLSSFNESELLDIESNMLQEARMRLEGIFRQKR